MQQRNKNRLIMGVFFFIVSGIGCYLWFSGAVTITNNFTSTISSPSSGTVIYQELTGKLYISPYGSHDIVLETLQQAKYSIAIWGYQISDEELLRVLRNKADSGVAVRIIIEKYTHGSNGKDYLTFYKQIAGSAIQVKDDEGLGITYQHAKTMLIDNKTYIISTANSTYPGFNMNREYRFIGENSGYVTMLTHIFTQDWQKKTSSQALPDNLRVCPLNCRTLIHTFIDSATTDIAIQAQYLEDPALIAQLQKKVAQGIQLRIIVGKYQEDNLPEDILTYTKKQSDPNVHAKNMLIDQKRLYIGSMNLSANAIDNNREIGIVTSDKRVIQTFLKQFGEDRAKQ